MHPTNHLRMHRKQGALSQAEIGQLLGVPNQADVSRYEHGARRPRTRTLIAAELLFETDSSELFPSLRQEVGTELVRRVRLLLRRLGARSDRAACAKRAYLLTVLQRIEARLRTS